jgi:tetratricopeptide (TPR) repeat protein
MSTVRESAASAWKSFQAGDMASAEQLYHQAVAADPQFADGWCLLGVICKARGDLVTAVHHYRQALRAHPQHFDALNNLGNILVAQGQYEEAVVCYRRALAARPNHAFVTNNLGAALRHLGRLDEAIDCYRCAVTVRPDYAEAHNNLGDALARQGHWQPAVASYRQALRLQPNYAEAHNNLGVALFRLGNHEEALAEYQQALHLKPNYAEAFLNLGNLQSANKQQAVAIGSYEQALRLNPRFAEAHYNFAIVLAEQSKLDDAIAGYRRALEIRPDHAEALANLGHALRAQGKLDESMAVYNELLQRNPDSPEGHMSRALVWLLLGDYEHGWPEYEWRWKTKEMAGSAPAIPRWDGSPLEGRNILLTAEQGLGDTIQFVRYAPLVQQRGGKVLLACQKALLPLLRTSSGIDHLVAREEGLPTADVYAPLMSLPALLGTTLATIPADVPYVFAESDRIEQWRCVLDERPGFKIGIAWQGNPKHRADCLRSLPLSALEPLARLPGVQLISLQKGPGTEQFAAVANRFSVVDLGSQLDLEGGAFLDTAAVMKNLDLVITVDTALAHLAGGLGARAWVALACGASDWRWLLNRHDSPWYPTIRLFRQRQPGDWTELIDRLAAELSNHVL